VRKHLFVFCYNIELIIRQYPQYVWIGGDYHVSKHGLKWMAVSMYYVIFNIEAHTQKLYPSTP